MLDSRPVENFPGGNHLPPQIVRFGIFEVDLQAGDLRRNGMKVRLQEQPFQVLRVLLERPGEVVSRSALREQLWPADTFVDFDHSLNAAIKRLRDALGDSAENPRFVETVARRGYRFVAPVNGAAAVSQPAVHVAGLARIHARPRWIVASVAAMLVILGVVFGFYFGRPSAPPPDIHAVRLTANPADKPVSAAKISPDGKYLAFSDETGFYLHQISTGERRAMPLIGGSVPRPGGWYPDSAHLVLEVTQAGQLRMAYSTKQPIERPSLWEISLLGGQPRKLNDEGWFPAVSPDGSQIAFVKGIRMNEQIWIMRRDGAQPRKLAGNVGDYFGPPVWSPDGRHLAYAKGGFKIGTGTRAVIEILDVKQSSVVAEFSPLGLGRDVAWMAHDRLIYSVQEPPPNQSDANLWWIQLDPNRQPTGKAVRLTGTPGAIGGLNLASDGKRLAFIKHSWQPDIYVASVEANGTRISEPRRLTLDERQDFPFDWSADSTSVIFISDRSGNFKIYQQPLDRTTPDLLVDGSDTISQPRLSPDGTQLLYVVYGKGPPPHPVVPLVRVPLAGGTPQTVLQGEEINNHQCARLPATTCIYSQGAGGVLTFFAFDPFSGPGKQILQIKDELPFSYNWSLSPDGSQLALAKKLGAPGHASVRVLPLAGGTEQNLVLKGWSGIGSLDWAADSKSLWLAAFRSEDETALVNLSLQGRVSPVWNPGKMTIGWAIPSRDGKHLALWQASGASNVWMLENFDQQTK